MSEQTSANSPRLADFYKGKRVFITGATGFVGKVCLLKILTSLAEVDKVYIVLRSKKGLSAQQRLAKMLQDEPFVSKIRCATTKNAKQDSNNVANNETNGEKWQRLWAEAREKLKKLDWSKVVVFDGDLAKPQLGLSDEAKEELWENVDIILNIAASVAFDAPLKQNLRDNYLGTSHMLNLATKCKKLISFVHVSTFYTNSHTQHITEQILPMERPCEKMADLIQFLPEKVCKSLETRDFMENRPNTYIYTKAMTEDLVKQYEGTLPLCVVRPSIIMPSIKDPVPNWVDNVNGPMGLGVLASLGILRTIDWNYFGASDIVPVDYVSNCILVCAERTARLHKNEIVVYNCSSSSLNPISWGGAFEILRAESFKAPPYKMLRIPIRVPKYKRANPIAFALIKWSELLFAYFIDLILTLCGQKTLLVNLTRKLHHGYKLLKPFTVNEYTCDNQNMLRAYNQLSPDDQKEFDFDIGKLDWKETLGGAYYGTRMAILKEDISNVPSALSKMRILICVTILFKILCAFAMGAIIWSYAISQFIKPTLSA